NMATQILEALLEETARREDFQAVLTLFQTLDQASTLPFAEPMPYTPLHLLIRGLARNKLGDQPAAIADFDQAIALKPDYAEAYWGRGLVRSVQGDWAAAIADFDQAIALKPDYVEAYAGRGAARQRQGDLAGANEQQLWDEMIETHIHQGQQYAAQGLQAAA